ARGSAELMGGVSGGEGADQVIRRDHDDSAVASFEAPAPGVTVIDSTSLTPEQVVAAVIDLVPAGGQTRSRT
ncbi:MAG: cytidylate kinase, partial [Acidipropionibacterium acidipropionici]|nr:cytidylate kinase [Acidipropionibacterium acidipropionici]